MKDFKYLEVFVESAILVKDVYSWQWCSQKKKFMALQTKFEEVQFQCFLILLKEWDGSTEPIPFNSYYLQGITIWTGSSTINFIDLEYASKEQFDKLNDQIQTCRKLLQGFINYIKESEHVKYTK